MAALQAYQNDGLMGLTNYRPDGATKMTALQAYQNDGPMGYQIIAPMGLVESSIEMAG